LTRNIPTGENVKLHDITIVLNRNIPEKPYDRRTGLGPERATRQTSIFCLVQEPVNDPALAKRIAMFKASNLVGKGAVGSDSMLKCLNENSETSVKAVARKYLQEDSAYSLLSDNLTKKATSKEARAATPRRWSRGCPLKKRAPPEPSSL